MKEKEITVLLSLEELALFLQCLERGNVVNDYNIKAKITFNYDIKSKLENTIEIIEDYLGQYGMDKNFKFNSLGVKLETLQDKFIIALQNSDKKY